MEDDSVKIFHDLDKYLGYCEEVGSDRHCRNKAYVGSNVVAKYKKIKNIL